MAMRIIIYSRQASGQNGVQVELLRKAAEDRGDTVVGIVSDDPAIVGRGKYAGWRAALRELAQIDQIVVMGAGDLPGKSTTDLLKILETVCEKGVSIASGKENLDTGSGSSAVLDLITAYRSAKRSEAIKAGQTKARMRGKSIGRPAVPDAVRRRIMDDLTNGVGVRATGRKNHVSAASVINVRRSMTVTPERQAA